MHDAGVWRLPDGAAYYRASLKSWATTDKTPEEIHKLGLDVVADSTAKLDALMKAQGMTKGSVGDRLRAMYKDPRYLYPNTDAAKDKLIADLNARCSRCAPSCRHSSARCPRRTVIIKPRAEEYRGGPAAAAITTIPRWTENAPASTGSICATPPEVPSWTLPSCHLSRKHSRPSSAAFHAAGSRPAADPQDCLSSRPISKAGRFMPSSWRSRWATV